VPSNKYFNLYRQKKEQNLLQDLVEEAIKIHAIDVIYIPRNLEHVDPILREDPLANFNDYHHIEVYIRDYDGFQGDGNVLSKFGLEIRNQITFSISRKSFSKIFGAEMVRPREGDLIYLPLSTAVGLYEIMFVNEASTFYNLGEFYTFDLRCEQYAFQDENISTGIKDLDENVADGSEVLVLKLQSSTGTFTENELIYQGDTALSATSRARFIEYASPTEMKIKDVYGTFLSTSGVIKGSISNVQATLAASIDTSDIRDDYSSQNKTFNELEFIDFTESNPFSEE
jgi:hypothetical protein